MTTTPPIKNAGVRFPPPFLFLIGLGVAWLLEKRLVRWRLIGGTIPSHAMEVAGVAVLLAGFALMLWGFFTFIRSDTPIIPYRPATKIVDYGPYRFSRNPMYAGISMAYFGGALIMNSGWALLLLPVVMLALYHFVVRKEEQYLSSAFPEDYASYRARVRRWL